MKARTSEPDKLLQVADLFYDGMLSSYSMVFFSKNRTFAWLILVATFIDPRLGIYGLAGVALTNGFAYWFGFNQRLLREGLFGLNSLLVSLALTAGFATNSQFLLILVVANLLTLFISVAMTGLLTRLGLPILSFPFLLALWTVLLAIREYSAMEYYDGTLYLRNQLFALGGIFLVDLYDGILNLPVPDIVATFLKSLGAIIFQFNLPAGLLVLAGILISSRINFTLALLGFFAGYLYYSFVGVAFTQLTYSYIGFNFILTSIAIGGFYFIPSRSTYLLVMVLTPVIAVFIGASAFLFIPIQLPVYSLPFVAAVLLVLYMMNFSSLTNGFLKTFYQTYSPEKNLYNFLNHKARFDQRTHFQIALPFFGEWKISQGNAGDITHKDEWQHAWDFVVEDQEEKTYRVPGTLPEHFYSYTLPVLAPGSGTVVEVVDDVPDNRIGEVNLLQNWGNGVVIKHGDFLYSQVSHLKAGSIKVKKGDYINKGEIIGKLGNSGRSPEPHIHFQLQSTPYYGSKTLAYPVSYFMVRENGTHRFVSYGYPQEGETVSNVHITPLLKEAFNFVPGKIMRFHVSRNGGESEEVVWEAFTNSLNESYLYCSKTKSFAWFVNNGVLHYFTSFEGDRNSLLYYFYLAAHRVMLGFYKKLELEDEIPIYRLGSGLLMSLQDFISPFYIFIKNQYKLNYRYQDDAMHTRELVLDADVRKYYGKRLRKSVEFSMTFRRYQLDRFEVWINGDRILAEAPAETEPELVGII